MMRLILDGQKNIEQEINVLKKESQEGHKKNDVEAIHNYFRDPFTPLDASIDQVAVSKDKTNENSARKAAAFINQSLLIRETVAKETKPRQKKLKKKKDFDLDSHF